MKTWRKATAVFLAFGILFLASCSGDRFYYAGKADPVGDITKTYGQPLWVESRADGSEKWVYRVHDPMGPGYLSRYFIIKDGRVIDGGVQ